MSNPRTTFRWVLALFVVGMLARVAWILLRGGPDAAGRAEGIVYVMVLGLLVLLLFYPSRRGPAGSD